MIAWATSSVSSVWNTPLFRSTRERPRIQGHRYNCLTRSNHACSSPSLVISTSRRIICLYLNTLIWVSLLLSPFSSSSGLSVSVVLYSYNAFQKSSCLAITNSYVIREQADGHWGIPLNDGNWTGIVGTLQHERADFAFGLTHTHARSPILDFTRIYIDDPVVIVSAKPRSLPNYLSLISPFSGNVYSTDVHHVFYPNGILSSYPHRANILLYHAIFLCTSFHYYGLSLYNFLFSVPNVFLQVKFTLQASLFPC